jgi:hypothetical protein
MRAPRMVVGAVVLTAPILSALVAFQGALPWAVCAAITICCTAIGATMSYYRLPLPAENSHSYGDV